MLGPARLPNRRTSKVDLSKRESDSSFAVSSPLFTPRSHNSVFRESSGEGDSLEMVSVSALSHLAQEESLETPPRKNSFAKRVDSPSISDKNKFLKLNIGGATYRIRTATLLKRDNNSFLYKFVLWDHDGKVDHADGYVEESDEWFFERSAQLFDPIYRYYITGICHKPKNVCLDEFMSELSFWEITNTFFAQCCWPQAKASLPDGEVAEMEVDEFENLKCGKLRRRIWNFIEVPESSFGARIFTFCSIGAVLVSNIGLVLGSIPDLQVTTNKTIVRGVNDTRMITITEPHPSLDYLEYVCITWFTLEYLAKMIVASNHKKTFLQTMNLIDVVAIFPFYIELTLQVSGVDTAQLQDLKGALLVVRILRVLRVIRIFKLGRYSTGLQTFAKTLKESVKQLGMMGMVLMTGIMFFSTLVYFLEKDEPDTGFTSIPAAFWWCIVTMTTVGYGDVVPITVGGKLVASGAIACGVLVLALPITIIVDNFMKVSEESNVQTGMQGAHPYMRSGVAAAATTAQDADEF